jgi:GT2 family glycosyltransferase
MSASNPVTRATVSAVVVGYSDRADTRRAIESLLEQSSPPLEVLVIDNHPERILATDLPDWGLDSRVRLVHSGENIGYTVACNRAAAEANGEWLFFMNPDASADTECLGTLLAVADPAVGALGAQVLLPDGRTNAGDNPVHLTGLAWAGRYGEPREHGPPRPAASVSGAALLVRRTAYEQVGGMSERFFLYYDDTDLCWRLRLAGWDVRFCPEAVVEHEYEFDKGVSKWYWLERNRLWSVMANYSLPALLLLLPLIVTSQLVIGRYALRAGWARALLRAWSSSLGSLPELLSWRRRVQATRRRPDSALIELMVGRFQTRLLDSPAASATGSAMELYRTFVLRILRRLGR